jgi:hypothetical protein
MTQTQKDIVIKSLYVNVHEKNIFLALRNLHAEMRKQKYDLQNVDFSFNNEDVRCKYTGRLDMLITFFSKFNKK